MLSVLHNKCNNGESENSQLSYRHQVIRALVQRYIESARREFEEAKRKGNVFPNTIKVPIEISVHTFVNTTGLLEASLQKRLPRYVTKDTTPVQKCFFFQK